MTKKIGGDHKRFRDVVSGRTRRQLKRLIKSGKIVRQRAKGGKMTIKIPRIDIPRFVHGSTGGGLGRGPGKEGDVIGRDPKGKGQGQGNKAGEEHEDGIQIALDMDDVLKFMKDELELPEMKPKPNETFEEIKVKYNDISKTGPDSLRHTKRTMIEALKRLAMTQDLEKLHHLPGSSVPMKLITPINSDRRYRQYTEIKIPSSNAVIFFARDCSASMDAYRCEIVSDMAWWIDIWIRQFYKKVERCYFIHDTMAEEVDEHKFYTYRQGGGTKCSSVFQEMAKQLESRFPPHAYNIYVFYFTDGENWYEDNPRLSKIVQEELGPHANLIGVTEVCPWDHEGLDTVKGFIDSEIKKGVLDKKVVTTVKIAPDSKDSKSPSYWGYAPSMEEEDRNNQIVDAIKQLLGKEKETATTGGWGI